MHQNYFREKMYYLWPVVHSFVLSPLACDFYLFIWFCIAKKRRKNCVWSDNVREHGGTTMLNINIKSWNCAHTTWKLNARTMYKNPSKIRKNIVISLFLWFFDIRFERSSRKLHANDISFLRVIQCKRTKFYMFDAWNLCGTLCISWEWL